MTGEVISIHHGTDILITMERGGIIKTHQYNNSDYKLLATENLNHKGFCKPTFSKENNTIYGPKDNNSIIGLSLHSLETTLRLDLPDNLTGIGVLSYIKYYSTSSASYILSGYESGKILLWDLKSLSVLSEFQAEDYVSAIDFDPFKNRGIIANVTDTITIFAINASQELTKTSSISIKNRGLNCAKIRRDAKIFCTAGWDSKIRVFSWKSLRPLAALTEHKGSVLDLVYFEDDVDSCSNLMASGGSDGQICIWKIY